ncbi:MAG: hypothetical protein H0W99_12555 [Acidobacteria bacterium]|nr:hypothetical protein [Acidobacteriota bacterium]
MASVFSTFWTQIRAAIAATWTDVLPAASGGGIHRAVSIQKIDWTAVALPYCVVVYRSRLWEQGPITAQIFDLDVEIFYIRADAASDTAESIDTKLEALDDALSTYAFPEGVAYIDTIAHDNTEENAANRALLALNYPMSAGSLRCLFRVGETMT